MSPRNLLFVSLLGLALVGATALPADAQARRSNFRTDKSFGLGLMVGSPTGLTAKYYMDTPIALQFGLGSSHYGHHHHDGHRHGDFHNDGIHLHGDVVWHPIVLTSNPTLQLPLYIGGGIQFRDHDHHDDFDGHSHLGGRVPFGIAADFNRIPLDIFFELAFAIDFIGEDSHSYISGSLGARFYF